MFCSKCGTKLPDGSKFCAACGARLGAREVGPAAPAQQVAAAPAPGPMPKARPRGLPVLVGLATVAVAAVGGALAWLAFFSPFEIDEKTFPDAVLRAVVANELDVDHDGKLSRDEGRAVTDLALSGAVELAGLGRTFPNLASLTVTGGSLARLDVGDLGELSSLDVAAEPLDALDVSRNGKLKALRVRDEAQVTGIESTGLQEAWTLEAVEETNGHYTTTYVARRDEAGRVVSHEMTSSDGAMQRLAYTYDEQGRRASKDDLFSLASWQGGGSSQTTVSYSYDDLGRLASAEQDNNYAEYYAYDDAGRLVEKGVGGVGDVTTTYAYAYDDAGRLVSERMAYKDQRGVVTTFVYDEQGRCVRKETAEEHSDGDGYWEVTTYELDAEGRCVRAGYDASWGNDSAYPVEYAYDEAGRMATASVEFSGRTETAAISYDERGNIARIGVTSETGAGSETTYTPRYARRFVEKGTVADAGLVMACPIAPLVAAQHMSLVSVWATPSVTPNPVPYAGAGESLVFLY